MTTLMTIVSDLHVGSSVGLCPEGGFALDDGGWYKPSAAQEALSKAWGSFFEDAKKISARKRVLVVNGDCIDGFHHNTVAVATNNIEVQERAAVELIKPILSGYKQLYYVRGTEAHVGQGGQSEERVAKSLGAEVHPDTGNHSAFQWWLEADGYLVNIAHHISTTSSAAYESSAVMREMTAALVEAGQWRQKLPDILVRSHRHRFIEVSIPSEQGRIVALVTPGWQLKTPFVERIDRMRLPHIGGVHLIIKDGLCHVKEKIFGFQNTPIVSI